MTTDFGGRVNGAVALTDKWPVLGRHEQAAVWLGIWTDLGRAPRTIDAYARGLAEYLLVCEQAAGLRWPRAGPTLRCSCRS
ncbi:hypothetical protein [Nocardia africana]